MESLFEITRQEKRTVSRLTGCRLYSIKDFFRNWQKVGFYSALRRHRIITSHRRSAEAREYQQLNDDYLIGLPPHIRAVSEVDMRVEHQGAIEAVEWLKSRGYGTQTA